MSSVRGPPLPYPVISHAIRCGWARWRPSALTPAALARRGRQVLDEDVGAGNEGVERRPIRRIRQIELEALLAAVGPHEIRRLTVHGRVVAPGEVTDAGSLDLEHGRTQVGEVTRCQRRSDGVFERDDDDTGERSTHQ